MVTLHGVRSEKVSLEKGTLKKRHSKKVKL